MIVKVTNNNINVYIQDATLFTTMKWKNIYIYVYGLNWNCRISVIGYEMVE